MLFCRQGTAVFLVCAADTGRTMTKLTPKSHLLIRSGFLGSVFLLAFLVGAAGKRADARIWQGSQDFASSASTHFAIADFDGDHQPDLATVEVGQTERSDSRYLIRFALSTGKRPTIGVTAPVGGVQIDSRDVNGDNVMDLIVVTAWLHHPVAVLLNDGHGNFSVSDPVLFPLARWQSEGSWNSPSLPFAETFVCPSQNPTVTLCESGRVYLSDWLPGGSVFGASSARVLLSPRAVLGRAPPIHRV